MQSKDTRPSLTQEWAMSIHFVKGQESPQQPNSKSICCWRSPCSPDPETQWAPGTAQTTVSGQALCIINLSKDLEQSL